MQSLIKIKDKVIATLDNGSIIEKSEISKETLSEIEKCKNDEEVIAVLNPSYKAALDEKEKTTALITNINKSELLEFKGDSAYWSSISPFSLPKDFADAILKAQEEGSEKKLEAYRNFWTLLSLNPDERCRKNLFWFLNKWGMVIAKCGFFVAYKNVRITKDPDIYTDDYTHTFKIRIGEMVVQDRKKCDDRQYISCSQGLHLGGTRWLKQNYCGNQGLVCLVNPVDVVAVPHVDNYGKLRCCAYLPIAKAKFGDNKEIVPLDVEDGFDCSYVTKVIYEGVMGTEEDSPYTITIPEIPGLNTSSITDTLFDIAMKCITDKVINDD